MSSIQTSRQTSSVGNTIPTQENPTTHAPATLKNIPESINRRLIKNAPITPNTSIKKHSTKRLPLHPLLQTDVFSQTSHPRRYRQRNTVCQNPPQSTAVTWTQTLENASLFLSKNTSPSLNLYTKFSTGTNSNYTCTNNVESIISNHDEAKLFRSKHNDQENIKKNWN